MRHPLCIVALFLAGTAFVSAAPAKNKSQKPTAQEIEQNTRLQIFLDQANFGPGKIDGHQGDFTRKALRLYRESKGEESAPADAKSKAPIDTKGLDLSGINPVFLSYQVTAEDAGNVGPLPSGPAAQSKVKRLPYATLGEGIAEKFHCDLGFLKQLNAGKIEKLKVGDEVTVPNVPPFDLAAVKALQPGADIAETLTANDLGGDPAADPTAAPATDKEESAKPTKAEKAAAEETKKIETATMTVHVSVKEEILEVRAADKLVASFPVTVGSQQTVSPIGNWKVQAVARMPNFRYDPKMLAKGERSSNFHMLPPGPNNPVGVLWIALNKKGIGMHGTNDPDSIGRSASHGCIRLANWDIVKLAELVRPGVAVTVE